MSNTLLWLVVAAKVAAPLATSTAVARLFGTTLGPLVKRRWPNGYAWLAAIFAFVFGLLPDVVAAVANSRDALAKPRGES